MVKIRYTLSILALILSCSFANAQSLKDKLTQYAANYSRSDANIDKTKYLGYSIDEASNKLIIRFGGGFSEQHFTESVVTSIYNKIKKIIPLELSRYKLSIETEDHPIEFLIPNSLRSSNLDPTRQLRVSYNGEPWVKNISRPYTASRGLEGNHISLWQSHGRYWRFEKNDWYWQRPRLFCTTEDLLSQTFVVPYLIPMLQNAGAVVFTTRERDYQKNEVVVDNDQPSKSGTYNETTKYINSNLRWNTTEQPGFANYKDVYNVTDSPFQSGRARYIQTTSGRGDVAMAQWIPNLPVKGKYAVYVTYPSYSNSAKDANYVVFHKGGMTEFNVNQTIGGGTWVYLGTFEFDQGTHDSGKVMLMNVSAESDRVVCADAVRFGGGMGNVIPAKASFTTHMEDTVEVKDYTYTPTGYVSGLPRWAEGSKYSSFWYGMPHKLHSNGFDNDEYKNDIWSRSQTVNELSGGSIYNRENEGRGVPFELNVAFHTDAGYDRNNYFGSLGIYMTDYNEGLTSSGMDRYVSRDLASSILTNLHRDLKKYNWSVRKLWNKDYGEARSPLSPAIILEMLSHQNFKDMKKAYDPEFKFDFCRSVYKSIVKFLATVHSRPYQIQPLPVQNFKIQLDEDRCVANLTWDATDDSLEPTATPTDYIIYTREGNNSFDNGKIVHHNSASIELKKGMVYSFRISALNKGGESFPSEVLSAYISPQSKGKILILNAFVRLDGPATVETDKEQGFRLDIDPGVQLGAFTGFCGKQKMFDVRYAGQEGTNALGNSGSDMEGKIVMGNTFDYPIIHGLGIQAEGNYSFCSVSEGAFKKGNINLSQYRMIDVIYGTQKYFDQSTTYLLQNYRNNGGRLLISGSNLSNKKLTDLSLNSINGCGTSVNIYREMNEYSYPVPSVSVMDGSEVLLSQPLSAFPIMEYSNHNAAASAYDGKDFKSIMIGFPIESIKDQDKINGLMSAFVSFLTAQ